MADVTPCNFCGSQNARFFLRLKDHRLHLPGSWDLLRCEQCGLLFLHPQPDWQELEAHYPKQYHAYLASGPRWLGVLRNYGLKRRAGTILKYKPGPGALLDVGCATGEFLSEFSARAGWHTAGVEVVPQAAEIARQKGLDIFTGSLPDAHYPADHFDALTLWDVLEHMPDPSAALRECVRILKPGGILLVKTPDPAGGEAGWFKQNWIGYEAPQHLFGFPRDVLIRQMETIGLRVIATRQTGTDYATFCISLGTWLKERGAGGAGQAVIKYSRTLPGRVLAAVFVWPLRLLGLKSSCTLIAQKNT